MKKFIVIAFTLKGQPFEKISPEIDKIKEKVGDAILMHGFLPRHKVEAMNFPTTVIDKFDELFPVQLNFWEGIPLRKLMAKTAKAVEAEIFIIGDIIEGVQEEADLYAQEGIGFTQIPI